MATQAAALHQDTNGRHTSAVYAADGDGVTRWYLHTRLSGLEHAEDAAHATGDLGILPLAVRRDTAAASSGTTGDYEPLQTDALGRLRVTGPVLEDAAAADGDAGFPMLAVRRDTAAADAGTDGDYSRLAVDSVGRLRVNASTAPVPSKASVSALAASLVVKASAGVVYRAIVTNTSGGTEFIQLHNATSLPADGAVPFLVYELPSNTTINLDLNPGVSFGTGIVICNSSTAATKTIAAADCWFDVLYE